MKIKPLAGLLIVIILLGTVPAAAYAKTPYTDIDGAWYTDDVRQYGYEDIFDDGSGKFGPGESVTRIEFVRLLHRALGISIEYFAAPDITGSFDDMKNTDAGAGSLIDFVTAGIVDGGGSFRPGDTLAREVMIRWLVKALDYVTGGNYALIKIMPAPFDDDAQITPAYANDIVTARLLNLVNGRGGNRLFPKDAATRAEAVAVASRLVTLAETLKGRVVVTPSAYILKDALKMSLTLTNDMNKTVTITHTSGQKFDFRLFDAEGGSIYTWSADKMFMAIMDSYELRPGESITYSYSLDLIEFPELRSAASMTAYITGSSDDFNLDGNGYTAEVVSKDAE